MFDFLNQRKGSNSQEQFLLWQLLLLAVTILTYCVIAMAIANSLFVNYVSAGALPVAFILIGLCSIPAYGLFSTAIDRYDPLQLFRFVLVLSCLSALGMRWLLNLDHVWVYYGLIIVVFFQWDFYNNILYPSLVINYFSPITYKRYAPFMGIAQAVGTLIGGGMTIVLSHSLRTRDLLWCLPILLAIAYCQILYLEKSKFTTQDRSSSESVSLLESIKSFPALAKAYPLVLLLAASSFCLVIIYLSSEFLWFNIYGNSFSEEGLTSFLGLMRIAISLVQVFVLYVVTRPLLQSLGVANLNIIYPLTTLISFGSLLANFRLPAAIGLHINGDALYKGINLPIHQLNYNAIPTNFRGRVRAFSDGLIYSLGLTLAGILLWVGHHYLSLIQITWIVVGMTIVLLFIRLPMGKYYTQGLEQMIQADLIDLADLPTSGLNLTAQSQDLVRALLTDSDRTRQLKGLEFVAGYEQASYFFPELQEILLSADDQLRDALLDLFNSVSSQESELIFRQLLEPKLPITDITAWELGIKRGYQIPEFISQADSQGEGQTSTKVATLSLITQPNIKSLSEKINLEKLTTTEQKSLLRAIPGRDHSAAKSLLIKLLAQGAPEIEAQVLKALVPFADLGDEVLAQIALQKLDHPNSLIKSTAGKIIELTRCQSILPRLEQLFADPSQFVNATPPTKKQFAESLAAYGNPGLEIAQQNLQSEHPEVVKMAIATLGKIRTKQASDLLFKYLADDFAQLQQTQQWQQAIPLQDPVGKPLLVAIADFQQRLIQKVLYILACLGLESTITPLQGFSTSQQNSIDIANSLEVLVSGKYRRFIQPLMPILEPKNSETSGKLKPVRKNRSLSKIKNGQWLIDEGYRIIFVALNSQDRWLKSASLTSLALASARALTDEDPVVKAIANEILAVNQLSNQNLMSRLLLLKEVSLFKNLSLDELLAVEKALISEPVLANQTVYAEGSWGSHFYIVAEGKVQLSKQVKDKSQVLKQLSPGQYFGEIAIFDDAPRWDTAVTLEQSILLKLEKKRFLSLISQRPHIILEICRFLSQRLRETNQYLSSEPSEV